MSGMGLNLEEKHHNFVRGYNLEGDMDAWERWLMKCQKIEGAGFEKKGQDYFLMSKFREESILHGVRPLQDR